MSKLKNLIFISGTMGVGKTTTSQALLKRLPNSVFLDGDWCWCADPFVVTDETKHMVLKNIAYLLNNFLSCSAYDNVIFCWVMHEQAIMDTLLAMLDIKAHKIYKFTLTCSETTLKARLTKDIAYGRRQCDIIERALMRLGNYNDVSAVQIDTNSITPDKIACLIESYIRGNNTDNAKKLINNTLNT